MEKGRCQKKRQINMNQKEHFLKDLGVHGFLWSLSKAPTVQAPRLLLHHLTKVGFRLCQRMLQLLLDLCSSGGKPRPIRHFRISAW